MRRKRNWKGMNFPVRIVKRKHGRSIEDPQLKRRSWRIKHMQARIVRRRNIKTL